MDLTKIFGVEKEEIFEFSNSLGQYRINNDGKLEFRQCTIALWVESKRSVNELVDKKVIHLPFSPKHGQKYYTIRLDAWAVTKATWVDDPVDYLRKEQDMVFRTYEDAGFACPKIYEKLTGKNWDDYDGM